MMDFANEIVKLCFEKYNILKNTGKPRSNEWTVLSAIVLKKPSGRLSVVSLSTGTKCLSGVELQNTTLWETGSRLNDSHAEILARRAFLRYLYCQIDLVQKNMENDVFFLTEEKKIELISDTTFHFFSSQSPCGDCSIISKNTNYRMKSSKVMKFDENVQDMIDADNVGTEINDIHRTGAKCLENEKRQDTYESGNKYHVLGPLRTKPGRGDRTLSLSCSDKIAKWIVVGVQGSLLSLLIPPIRFHTIIIAGGCPFSLESTERGLYKRFNYAINVPKIIQAEIPFAHIKNPTRTQACPRSIIWCAVPNREIEIAVEGRKQGTTKKKKGSCLLISRREILKTFFQIFENSNRAKNFITHPKKITYFHCKQSSHEYQELWQKSKTNIFHTWPLKPQHLQNFIL